MFARGKPLYIGVTEVDSGRVHIVAARTGNLEQAIRASTALPTRMVFMQVDYEAGRAMAKQVIQQWRGMTVLHC